MWYEHMTREFRRCCARDWDAFRGKNQSLRERIRVYTRPRHDLRQDHETDGLRRYRRPRGVGEGGGRGASYLVPGIPGMFFEARYLFVLPAFFPVRQWIVLSTYQTWWMFQSDLSRISSNIAVVRRYSLSLSLSCPPEQTGTAVLPKPF